MMAGMRTDKELINWLEDICSRETNDVVEIQGNTLIGSQPGQENKPLQLFSVPSQHIYGKTVRELLTRAIEVDDKILKFHGIPIVWDK